MKKMNNLDVFISNNKNFMVPIRLILTASYGFI